MTLSIVKAVREERGNAEASWPLDASFGGLSSSQGAVNNNVHRS